MELARDRCSGRGNNDGCDDDKGGVAEAEERANGDEALTEGDQTSGCEVNGGDVVGVESMPEAEGV